MGKHRRINVRAAAALAVARVRGGQSLADVLPGLQARVAPRDRGLLQELAFGTLRWHDALDHLAGRLLKRPLKRRDADVHALLLVGLYQLTRMRLPAHAAVHDTVGGVRDLGKAWARGLANGVLRAFQRQQDDLLAELEEADAAVRLAFPRWLLDRLRADWPEDWEAIADNGNQRPPMTLRVNRSCTDREAFLGQLREADIPARATRHAPAGVVLDEPMGVDSIPGFEAGQVSVQDEAAQLCTTVLAAKPGERVLDACAAPGGKTAALLEAVPDLDLLALDRDAERLVRVDDNLDRLGLTAHTLAADAADTGDWWSGEPFQRILLDAPCTGTGVIRRHPDIKHLRRSGDVESLARQQARLLDALWETLAPGGRLVYATCSILKAENEEQVAAFLERHGDARHVALAADWGRERPVGRQILPGDDGMDGFFYACLEKD